MSEQKTADAAQSTPEAAAQPAKATAGKAAASEARAPAKKPATRKPSRLEETKARNKKALAEALAAARAVRIPPTPEVPLVPKAKAPAKPAKGKRPKLVRDSFTMPEDEYARIAALKKRMAGLGGDVKKSELLRAGLGLLAALQNKELAAVMAGVERVRTGRPKK